MFKVIILIIVFIFYLLFLNIFYNVNHLSQFFPLLISCGNAIVFLFIFLFFLDLVIGAFNILAPSKMKTLYVFIFKLFKIFI